MKHCYTSFISKTSHPGRDVPHHLSSIPYFQVTDLLLFNRGRVHVEDFPQMTIGVLEAPSVHKSMIHRIIKLRSPGRQSPVYDLVHLLSAIRGKGENDFGMAGCIGNFLVRKAHEVLFGLQHSKNMLANHETCSILVRKLRVKLKTDLVKKSLRLVQIFDRQIDKDLI